MDNYGTRTSRHGNDSTQLHSHPGPATNSGHSRQHTHQGQRHVQGGYTQTAPHQTDSRNPTPSNGYNFQHSQWTSPSYGPDIHAHASLSSSPSLCFARGGLSFDAASSNGYDGSTSPLPSSQFMGVRVHDSITSGFPNSTTYASSGLHLANESAYDPYGSAAVPTGNRDLANLSQTRYPNTPNPARPRSARKASTVSSMSGSNETVYCDECGASFHGKCANSNKKRHEREQHNEETKIECKICRNTYTRNDYRLKHEGRCRAQLIPVDWEEG